jgi:AcrR family transcriptional regulator
VTPTERPALVRDEVVRVALQLLDEVGLDGLTMRSLAERLGVKAASLYWHLRDKDELAELLLEAINAEIPETDPGLPWRQRIEEAAWAWRRVLLRHRDAARLAMGRFVVRPETLRRIESVLGTLREAGFSPSDTANAAYIFSNFVPGFVVEETTPRPTDGRPTTQSPVSAPGLGIDEARLEIGWAKRLDIRADPLLPELYSAYSEGQPPEIYASNGVVNLLQTKGRKPSTLLLNATVPWTIEVRNGASNLSADLRGLQLRAFQVKGGTSSLELTAPIPAGTVPIQLSGGTSRFTIHRPAEVPVRIDVRGGISHLTFDQKPFRSAAELTVQSPGYERAADRYDVRLTGGVSRVEIDTVMPPESSARSTSPPRDSLSQAELSATQYPNLVALAGEIMNPSMDDRFRFGVKILLDGLEQRLHESRSRLPSPARGANSDR